MEELIVKLEIEWDREVGFLGLFRCGEFSEDYYQRFIHLLEQIKLLETQNQSGYINKQLVALLWYCPVFLSWQKETLLDAGILEEKIAETQSVIEAYIEEILGIP